MQALTSRKALVIHRDERAQIMPSSWVERVVVTSSPSLKAQSWLCLRSVNFGLQFASSPFKVS